MVSMGWVTVRGYTVLVFDQVTQAYSAWPSLCGYKGAMSTGDGPADTGREETASSA